MAARYKYLLRYYVLTVLFFIVAKPVFMLCNRDAGTFSLSDMGQVVWHGLTLDLSTALYVLLLPYLYVTVSVWKRLPAWPLRVYSGIIALALALVFVADTSLYAFWKFKLDASCLTWLETPGEAMASVSISYLLLRLLITIVLALIIYKALTAPSPLRSLSRNEERGTRNENSSVGKGNLVPPSSFLLPRKNLFSYLVSRILLHTLLLILMLIGIRGGIDESTTNVGQVYFSQNQFLNHSAVNPLFSFLSSFENTASRLPDYHFMSEAEQQRALDGCFFTDSEGIDTLLNTQRPNVVIILMESSGELFAHVMPRLQQLKQEGICFTHCHANSWRTDRGTVCTLSGYPSFPTASVMKMPNKAQALPGIAASLRREGYATSYVYGGDINFTNMRSYLVSTGFERLYWKDDYSLKEQNTSKWGVRDDITFGTVAAQIADYTAKGQPFVIGYSTLSSHEPWDVPLKKLNDEVDNAFYYLDQCLGNFVDSLRQTPAWTNLLIVLLPDHGIPYHGLTLADLEFSHIPMVWIGGAVKQARSVGQYCNQTDLAATLLGQMGIAHDDFRFSRDVMSSRYTKPFAVCTFNNGFVIADSASYGFLDLTSGLTIAGKPDGQQLINRGKALLQAAAGDLKELNSVSTTKDTNYHADYK